MNKKYRNKIRNFDEKVFGKEIKEGDRLILYRGFAIMMFCIAISLIIIFVGSVLLVLVPALTSLLVLLVYYLVKKKKPYSLVSIIGQSFIYRRVLETFVYAFLAVVLHPTLRLISDQSWPFLLLAALAFMSAAEALEASIRVKAGVYGTSVDEVKEIARVLIKDSKTGGGGDGERRAFPDEQEEERDIPSSAQPVPEG